ncbi:hypothetical protein HU200_055295 [Digitaria exilis]|uniref:Uncharacterized protein n=1 Tax=Digitaria exilis TaxID=1010633 RepID=A0A835E511_9POAL|nr:hypothetical protein HU200_055295 [Digitaria exilis]
MAFLRTLNPLIRRSTTAISDSRPLLSLHTFLASSSPTTITPAAASPAAAPLAGAAHTHVPVRSGGPLFLSSPPWMLSQSATPLTAALRDKLRRAQALAGGRAQAVADAVQWDRKRISGGEAEAAASAGTVGGGGERFLNAPNLVSIGRMVSGPVIGCSAVSESYHVPPCYFLFCPVLVLMNSMCIRMIVNEWYLPAFATLAVSGASDWLDGFLARKMGINSVFGSYLDPLADKVLIGCVAVAMVQKDLLHSGLVGLVVMRDLLLVGGAFYKRASILGWKVEPLFISKVNTVFQLMLVAAALLQPEFGTEETQNYITLLSWLVATTTITSTIGYGVKYYRIKPRSP